MRPPTRYAPCASETAVEATSVALLRTVMVAPGTTASEVSLIVPVTVARSTCAEMFGTCKKNTAISASMPCNVRFMKLLQSS